MRIFFKKLIENEQGLCLHADNVGYYILMLCLYFYVYTYSGTFENGTNLTIVIKSINVLSV